MSIRTVTTIRLILLLYAGYANNATHANTTVYSDSIVNLKEIAISAAKHTGGEGSDGASSEFGRAASERLNIGSAKNLSAMAPNLFIPEYGSRMTSSIYVRGLGSRIDQPVVGLNIDNIPVLNKDNYDFDILDIERIKVMRGPQSTLYGRNTMGGVIDIRTLSPISYQGTRILAEYGNANSIKAGVSHYSRPTQRFGAGGGISFFSTDGFFKNLYNGEMCDKEKNGRATLKLAWKPSEDLILENMAGASLVRQGGYAYEFAGTREINYNDTCFYRRTSVLDGLTVKWNTAHFSLTSVTSYQYSDDNMTLDQDFLPESYFTLTQKRKEHAVTQDIVLKGSAASGKIDWLGGAFGFFRRTEMDAPVTFKAHGIEEMITSKWNEISGNYPMRWDSDNFLLGSAFSMPNCGIALYGEASAKIGRLTATAGLRIDHESTELSYTSDCSTGYTIYRADGGTLTPDSHREVEIHNTGNLTRAFTQLLPKLSLVYAVPIPAEATVYATASKGYKAGGFNTQMFSDVLRQELMSSMGIGTRYDVESVVGYKPEKSWNCEIGGKIKSPDGKIAADFAAFYINCSDQQLTVFPDGDVTGRIMTNAGKTRSAGAELSVSLHPVNRLHISAGYGYTNAKFIKFDNGKTDYSGKFIPYAPQNTIFAAANYGLNTAFGPLRYISFGVSASGAGKIYWNEENSAVQNFYMKLDASVKFVCDRFSADIWAKNITGTQYNTFYFVSIQHEFLQKGKPVQFGATLRVTI